MSSNQKSVVSWQAEERMAWDEARRRNVVAVQARQRANEDVSEANCAASAKASREAAQAKRAAEAASRRVMAQWTA